MSENLPHTAHGSFHFQKKKNTNEENTIPKISPAFAWVVKAQTKGKQVLKWKMKETQAGRDNGPQ